MEKEITLTDIYRYVALSFRYPEVDWFTDDFLQVYFEISHKAGLIQETLEARGVLESPDWLEEIQVEYTRLFVTSADGVVAAPYGSVYIDGNGLLYDRYTDKVARYYVEKGFALKDNRHPSDYLVYQLDFMATLVQNDPAALEEFIVEYFRPWFEPFMAEVLAHTAHPYFILIVKLADFFSSPEG